MSQRTVCGRFYIYKCVCVYYTAHTAFLRCTAAIARLRGWIVNKFWVIVVYYFYGKILPLIPLFNPFICKYFILFIFLWKYAVYLILIYLFWNLFYLFLFVRNYAVHFISNYYSNNYLFCGFSYIYLFLH